ncbi:MULTISPECIES: 3-deoxy-D-manno-octulosonic acid transferase [unclassified Arenibacter]|uniref:3-deoxy-D-manno-octulosonic acid transferase n=1 Tax=unclassified Arenibacter TaxID=2615047 RepID=UPI000E34E6ED|nr:MULTISPECIES: glycosyltransferase N-terminal domain-containing protein [unclassified Arenibacter]MCM4162621.1 3-deoxy-D-manno-octulosonic acid transferase [Arenibacter sp. A80]RFT58379.1 3-deoxy-D-manno-octulosonic acid transferase [Arenibacter sp. P308M17]
MFAIYNFAVQLSALFLKLVALFHSKIKLFVDGRKGVMSYLRKNIGGADSIIWVHTASLGEFEQGLPIIEQLKRHYPAHRILVTFFSPSGYEVKKNTAAADMVTYLPMDTKKNVRQFLDLIHPKLVIFVKYEIWPNYMKALSQRGIPTLLISALFKEDQIYFKGYGSFMRKALHNFTHIFVQDAKSIELLSKINIRNTTINGDTRFDRVVEILDRDNNLSFMENFKNGKQILVAGSTWAEDEEILVPYINAGESSLKFVLAPHNIKQEHINKLKASITKKTILYSEMENKELSNYDVLVIDTIGLLTKIYSYAEISYVGGGFSTGLHNTLEPAVYGIPVIIGPNFKGFKEAEDLVNKGGVLVVKSTKEFFTLINDLQNKTEYLKSAGDINSTYISENKGASIQIMAYIRTLI